MISRELCETFPTKEEDHNNAANIEKGSSSNPPSSSSSLLSSWSRLKDPRIVRVSRAFGGKDRHSKVCTVRGLRDRRVRLSVPTAIQLYDLQDRLGLNQPSKVVDWLLNVAKNEIDELPPLQMPVGGGALIDEGNFRSILGSHLGKEVESNDQSNPWISDTLLRNNEKDAEGQGLSLVNNSSSSEQQFMTWDSSSSALSLTQSRTHDHEDDVHHEHHHHHHHQQSNFNNVLPFMTSATHQVLVYQPPPPHHHHHQSYFGSSSNINPTEEEEEVEDYVPKQFNFHMLDSSSDQNNHQFSNPQDRRFH